MAREICPLCEMRGKVSPLTKRAGAYGCGTCSRIYTSGGLAEAKRKRAREWRHRIELIRAGHALGLNCAQEGVTRAGRGEIGGSATIQSSVAPVI